MIQTIASMVRSLIRRLGIDVVRYRGPATYPSDFSDSNIEICNTVKPYTMTSPERVNALIDAVHYVVAHKIDGSIVECGVYKGGSAMAMMIALLKLKDENRELYLYDTFSGMNAPTEADVSIEGESAHDVFDKARTSADSSSWCLSPLDEVKQNVFSTGYPKHRIHFIPGKVEDTIPGNMPEKIALLRLDTDWYESTRHELTHLFPLLQPNGVLILDDYGHWKGARKAVDEYFCDKQVCILLNRIDYTGRIAIKT